MVAQPPPPLSLRYALTAAALACLSAFLYRLRSTHWLLRPALTAEAFPRADMFVKPVPTIHYDDLANVTSFVQGFVLYRSNKDFVVNITEMLGSELLRVRIFDRDCKWNSLICSPCFKGRFATDQKIHTYNVSTILEHGSEMYSSFAALSNSGAQLLWSKLGLGFEMNEMKAEHTFVANLTDDRITASWHANSVSSSMAVQIAGKKTWLFLDRETYLNDFKAAPAVALNLPTRSPKRRIPIYVYTSEPGDVIFFPSSYAHAVITHPGPNLMINYRKVMRRDFTSQPFTWLTSFGHMVASYAYSFYFNPKPVRGTEQKTSKLPHVISVGVHQHNPNAVPEHYLNHVAWSKIDAACEQLGKGLPIDDQILNELLDREVWSGAK